MRGHANQIEFFGSIHGSIQCLFVPVNPTDPAQNPVSTTEGSVQVPKQALAGGVVLSIGKVIVCHKGTERLISEILLQRGRACILIPLLSLFSLSLYLLLCLYNCISMSLYKSNLSVPKGVLMESCWRGVEITQTLCVHVHINNISMNHIHSGPFIKNFT